MKRKLSIVMSALLITISIFSYYPTEAAITEPKLQMVTQPATEYRPGERVSFTVSSPNYGGKVEYRVILYNGTTKTTSELWKIPATGYYYKNWQPSGNYNFTINWPVVGMEPGAYSLTVLVRRVGSKSAYDSFVKTNSFWIKTESKDTIISIDDIEMSRNIDDTSELPKKVSAKFNNGEKKDVDVVWFLIRTEPNDKNICYYEGIVKNYDKKVMLKLTIIDKSLYEGMKVKEYNGEKYLSFSEVFTKYGNYKYNQKDYIIGNLGNDVFQFGYYGKDRQRKILIKGIASAVIDGDYYFSLSDFINIMLPLITNNVAGIPG